MFLSNEGLSKCKRAQYWILHSDWFFARSGFPLTYVPYGPTGAFIVKLLRKSPYFLSRPTLWEFCPLPSIFPFLWHQMCLHTKVSFKTDSHWTGGLETNSNKNISLWNYQFVSCLLHWLSSALWVNNITEVISDRKREREREKKVMHQLRVGLYGEKLWPQSWKSSPWLAALGSIFMILVTVFHCTDLPANHLKKYLRVDVSRVSPFWEWTDEVLILERSVHKIFLWWLIIVTSHRKMYTNTFLLNGLKRWVSVGSWLEELENPLEVLRKTHWESSRKPF